LNQGDLSGGAILDLHIHDADFVRHLLGDPRGFHSVGTFGCKGYDYVFTNYVYPGVAVSAEGGWNMPSGFPFEMSFRAVFEQGTIFYSSRHTPMTLYRADGKNVPVKVPQPQVKGGGAGGNISSLGGYFNEIQYFVNCVSRGKKPEMATVQDARDSVALALAEIRSAERNAGRR